MTSNPERKYVAVSIKHSTPRRRYSMTEPLVLWSYRRTEDSEPRSFAGYTCDPENAELYTQQEWEAHFGKNLDWIKTTPVPMSLHLLRDYKDFDSVIVPIEDYMSYYRLVCPEERS